MKNSKKLLILSLVGVGSVTMTGCDLFGKKETSKIPYAFSIGLKSGSSILEMGTSDQIVIYNNGENTDGHDQFTYTSTKPAVATINSKGVITPKSEGSVNFIVTDKKSKEYKTLKKDIVIANKASTFSGGDNFSGGTTDPELAERAKILGKLEKYAMDTHLTGITLFDNGGYVKHHPRVQIPVANKEYIQGFGFGVLSDGTLDSTKPLEGTDFGNLYPSYYHTAVTQDSKKINMYTAAGSQVSDLASYISSSYWGTKLNNAKNDYDWAPMLASKNIYRPIVDPATGEVTGNEAVASENNDPIPVEKANTAKLYRKWRIYVKTDGDSAGGDPAVSLKYTKFKAGANPNAKPVIDTKWNNRGVQLKDYLFAYKLLLTGSNKLLRGTEMANDSSYGIRGAQRYFNATESKTSTADINAAWKDYIDNKNIGLAIGEDDKHQKYIEIELVNPIDVFTAKYTLSSNLVSPLPEEFFLGEDAFEDTFWKTSNHYGTFNDGGNNAILNYTICLGPYTLAKWVKDVEIVFATNTGSSTESNVDNTGVRWFECDDGRYRIPGVYYRKIDTSSNSEKVWEQFTAKNLDSAGVPASKIKTEKDKSLPTKGDATFKLNVNSCTKEQWNYLFGPKGKIKQNRNWKVKEWMSNQDFLDGLFYSIDRKQFADKRGVTPSINYFSDAYQMRNSSGGSAYNTYVDPETGINYHEEAVKGYSENYGYNKDKAIDCFRNAVKQLAAKNKITLGSAEKPTTINIEIKWMYQTDLRDYGEDIINYFESAFNDKAVCGGKVKLKVIQSAVTNWEDVYDKHMMVGEFDLGFGAISGNTYNPLNFFEVLKSDNSSSFTLNWGPDTSSIDSKNPIIYKGKKWSFDALWEVADHGGIVKDGKKVAPVLSCSANPPTQEDGSDLRIDGAGQKVLYEGFKVKFPVKFSESDTAQFDVNRLDVYIANGGGVITLAENTKDEHSNITYHGGTNAYIEAIVTPEKAAEVNAAIKKANSWQTGPYDEPWQENPFVFGQIDTLFSWDLYYELTIKGNTSVNYVEIKHGK